MICIEYVLYKKENQTCLQSASARGLWIEIRTSSAVWQPAIRQLPRGGCGLKYRGKRLHTKIRSVSFRKEAVVIEIHCNIDIAAP